MCGPGSGRKRKGVARIRLRNGSVSLAELHRCEAHGIGRKALERKRSLDRHETRSERKLEAVVGIDNDRRPASLELHEIDRALPDRDARRDGDVRVIDESAENDLLPAECFACIDIPETVRASLPRAS